jgi:hypothetical protein
VGLSRIQRHSEGGTLATGGILYNRSVSDAVVQHEARFCGRAATVITGKPHGIVVFDLKGIC